MNRNAFNDGWIDWTVGLTLFRSSHDLESFHGIQHLPPIQHAPKDGIDIVEMFLRFKEDKELTSIGVGALVGHGKHATFVVDIEGLCKNIYVYMTIVSNTFSARFGDL